MSECVRKGGGVVRERKGGGVVRERKGREEAGGSSDDSCEQSKTK